MKVGLFKRGYSLNRVRDKITVREGNETLELFVDSDSRSLIHRLQEANKEIEKINGESTDEQKKLAAVGFAEAMFGGEQAGKLMDFYHGDYASVITICSMYFEDKKNGLAKKITKAQKKGG